MFGRSNGIVKIVSLLLVFLWPGPGQAVDDESISALGEAEVAKGNFAQARKEALEEAMKAAVTTVAGDYLPPDLFQQNEDIILERVAGKPRKFVKDYRLVREERIEEGLRVEAQIVPRRDQIQSELVKWGILFDRAQRPRFGLFPLEVDSSAKKGKKRDAALWTRSVAQRLRGLGYQVDMLQKGDRRSQLAGEDAKYDVAVWGTVNQVTAKAVVIHLEAALREPYSRLVDVRDRFSTEEGLTTAAGWVATMLLEKLLPPWFARVGSGRVFEVTVTGWTSYPGYKEFLEFLNSGRRGFSSGRELVYAPREVTFEVIFEGSVTKLSEELSRLTVAGKLMKVTEARNREVRLEVGK